MGHSRCDLQILNCFKFVMLHLHEGWLKKPAFFLFAFEKYVVNSYLQAMLKHNSDEPDGFVDDYVLKYGEYKC